MEDEAVKTLKMRYARGEISKKEYLEMKENLKEEEAKNEDAEKPEVKTRLQKGSSGSGAAAAIIILLLVGGGFYLLSTGALNSLLSGAISHSTQIANPIVTVSGYVKTTFGTSSISVTFGLSTTTVDSNGHYSISLQNSQAYPITVKYSSISGTNTCNAGSLNLQTSSSSYNYNVTC